MPDVAAVGITSLGEITAVLVVGVVFGGSVRGPTHPSLIALLLHLTVKNAPLIWKLIAPIPLFWYTILLAGTDSRWSFVEEHFTVCLVVGTLVFYMVVALVNGIGS